jgi:hypothetical protein
MQTSLIVKHQSRSTVSIIYFKYKIFIEMAAQFAGSLTVLTSDGHSNGQPYREVHYHHPIAGTLNRDRYYVARSTAIRDRVYLVAVTSKGRGIESYCTLGAPIMVHALVTG